MTVVNDDSDCDRREIIFETSQIQEIEKQ